MSFKSEGVMRRYGWIALGVTVLALAYVFWPRPAPLGNPRFFADQTYNFETMRVLSDNAPAGGDSNEATQAIAQIKTGDAESWYAAWNAEGDRLIALAAKTADPIGKGHELLRAHTYYRSAEFFLDPHDPKRPVVWKKNIAAFYAGLDTLGVRYERISVPYGSHHLNAVYYPGPAGAEAKPLIVLVGGYDSTLEELYLQFVGAACQHGYSVLTYEGPGQGSVLREQGLIFTPEWEKPNGAVLDAFLASHAKPPRIVLIGESMGGYLAPRAAAFDSRIDGVVAYDVFFDGYTIATRAVPPFAFWLARHHYYGVLNFLSGLSKNPGTDWAQKNGMWTLGTKDSFAVLDAFKPYTLAPVAARIHADVLVLAGADDHFVPANQLNEFKKSLVNARSVTAVTYDRASGGSEHCQLGAPSLWQTTVFEWIKAKFG
jgi:alpha-beta hydrolase superfamily lysophospholipase